jgi:hypothetical protein
LIFIPALALASAGALAFEETTAGVSPDRQQSAVSPNRRVDVKPPLNLNGTGTSLDTSPPAAGTEVRIPGLGKLGVIPKLDFGLELLYGGREERAPEPDRNRAETDDVHIRGSIRHRF